MNLRCRNSQKIVDAEQISARIVADKFDEKTEDGINNAVGDQNLSVKFFLFVKINQQAEHDKHRD